MGTPHCALCIMVSRGTLCRGALFVVDSKVLQIMHPDKMLMSAAACSDDKVTVLESEKRAWESSPEAQAMKDALNPWRRLDEEKSKP
ncbi:hypothetical protein KFK09_000334 [Dendrobium nobile]|uniref:Uncharacterized protein n=1 Tax=Dendrobium nobile TaxID=94219 RepID=A0A8T3CAT7_DENNO|nr:hypothetical protein KFK09_000334 [Dendrobium nobile]